MFLDFISSRTKFKKKDFFSLPIVAWHNTDNKPLKYMLIRIDVYQKKRDKMWMQPEHKYCR